jgi:hypothetical protein
MPFLIMVIDRDDDGVPAHCDIESRDSVDFKDEDPLQRSLSFVLLLLASAKIAADMNASISCLSLLL